MTDDKHFGSKLTQQKPVDHSYTGKLITYHRPKQRFSRQPALSDRILEIIANFSIVTTSLFGIGALGYWGLEIVEANTISTIESRYDWQTQKHICLGWMLVTFSSFIGSSSLGNRFHQ